MLKSVNINETSKFNEVLQSSTIITNGNKNDNTDQVTSQDIINSLPRYTFRGCGAYLSLNCVCGICQKKYSIGNSVVCLPCQHNFHGYCIENWLRWVKLSCPIDKKSIIRPRHWTNKENEMPNSNFLTASGKKDLPALIINSNIAKKNKTPYEDIKAISNEKPYRNRKIMQTKTERIAEVNNYPLVITSLPLLNRFCYFMDYNGCESSNSLLQKTTLQPPRFKKIPSPKPTALHSNPKKFLPPISKVPSKQKTRDNSSSLIPHRYSKPDYLPYKSNSPQLSNNWITISSLIKKENDNLSNSHKNDGYCDKHSIERVKLPKIIVKAPVTFANAFKRPAVENSEWLYKKKI